MLELRLDTGCPLDRRRRRGPAPRVAPGARRRAAGGRSRSSAGAAVLTLRGRLLADALVRDLALAYD